MQLKDIKGIGEKSIQLFNKIGIYDVNDLLNYYPRNYDIYNEPILIDELQELDDSNVIAVEGAVAKAPEIRRTAKLQILTTVIKDKNGSSIKVTWFNMPFLMKTLKIGCRYIFRGYIAVKNGNYVLEQPNMYSMSEYKALLNQMQPVYGLTKGLSNKLVIKAISQVLESKVLLKEYIPIGIREEYNLAEHNYAVRAIHFPKDMQAYTQARRRLVFEEFFLFIMSVRRLKESNESQPNNYPIENDIRTDELINQLPYRLTNAQKNAWEEVKANMASDKLMNRLIQGDVGSGKTIIAILALMNTAYAGLQGAMMVPTEVLAKQQYETINKMFEKYNISILTALLIGSMTAKEKRAEYEKIQSGKAQIIIGTHALIQEKVNYNRLGLVITDEQHRFGVKQREALSDKGVKPHIMVMSATPIPRTLAIIIYGDLDISVIDELPSNRLPIKNCVVDETYRAKAYKFITAQVSQGRQAYVICPMVEESDLVEAENVVEYSEKLRDELPPNVVVEYLHGKMKAAQKNAVMDRFTRHEIDVLVSTTVIEVGVNVPNSTVMMIENADRFGLAQLHQLRGRVGRGQYQSYCIFVSSSKSKATKKRLEILSKSNDGFKIAQEDMKLRGPGDFFGNRQSGIMEFTIGDIFTDANILKDASEAAEKLLYQKQAGSDYINTEEMNELNEKLDTYMEKYIMRLNI